MALESANYIDGLVPANPSSTDSVSQADDHLRLLKTVLKNTFPNLTGPVTATQAQINQPIPIGFIGMWAGSIAAVPTGWALCDGTNGTPDLRDRFIVGAGSTYAVGATGGANTVTLTEAQIPSHTHNIALTSSSSGAHTHSITDPGHSHTGGVGAYNGSQSPTGSAAAGAASSTGTSTTGITVSSAGAHTHTINGDSASTGGGAAHENRPPYFALAYIMKL